MSTGAQGVGPKMTRPDESQVVHALGETYTFRVPAANTNGAYSIIEIQSPPQGGAPPHINTREEETHIVLEGKYTFVVGDQTIGLEPGGVVIVPRGFPHAFENVGNEPARLLLVPWPGGNVDQMVLELADTFADPAAPSLDDPAALEKVVAVMTKYGLEVVPPPAT
jgi:mannose-6-phosphate isomerase-like protein (cupin superfamily)